MQKVELLAPAGDIEKMKIAFLYGADAVYLGGRFGLRASASVEDDDLKQAVDYAHSIGKRVYVTVNIFVRNKDFPSIKEHVKHLEKIGVDAVIVSDLGVMKLVREDTNLDIHVSTQANVLNKYTAEEYVRLGAKRIILGRECSLTEIKEIAQHVRGKCEIEVFIHGAMCVSYSGRCLLSNAMQGRDANRGECSHPCRWKYSLMEEKRPGEYFPIEEDAHGTYVMNSKDLCLIDHLDKLKDAGVTAFKIEGRNKSEYYVAGVVNAYHRELGQEELQKIAHRPYTTGFLLGENDHLYEKHNNPVSGYDVVAKCLGGDRVELRNAFNDGDELEILSYGENHNKVFVVTGIREVGGVSVQRANKADEVYTIQCPYKLNAGEFLRKRREK